MLIPEDSPLRNPPANMPPAQKAACDALRFAFDMTSVSYGRLLSALQPISVAIETDKPGSRPMAELITCALLDAWGLVDNVWRLHQVVRDFPGLKKTPDIEPNLRALAKVENLRHGIQHVAGKFKTAAEKGRPILGSLSWFWAPTTPVTGGWTITIAAGALRRVSSAPIAKPKGGEDFDVPIGLIGLTAFGETFDLSDARRRVRTLATVLDGGLRAAVGDAQRGGADAIISARIDFHPTDPPNRESQPK